MKELERILLEGGHSIVVRSTDGVTHEFDGSGVSDLLRMVNGGSALLRGAQAADKVVGKAAASLLVLGGVNAVWAGVMSQPAVALLRAHGVDVSCGVLADHIENRARSGWCPMETACRECATAEECLRAINDFVAAKK